LKQWHDTHPAPADQPPPDADLLAQYDPAEASPQAPPATPAEQESAGASRRAKSALREFLETIALAVIVVLLVRVVVMNYRVVGHSMEPNIHEGQFLLIDKLFYAQKAARRGDIIILRPPDVPDQIYVKRVIGVPGDTVEVRTGSVLVNGEQLQEPWTLMPFPTAAWGPATVAEGELFVMGDNRPGSRDSRYFGMLPRDNVIGRAFLCYWPPTEWTTYPVYDEAALLPGE